MQSNVYSHHFTDVETLAQNLTRQDHVACKCSMRLSFSIY